jgi:endonuclease/exonuclease/phosphatase family metal-dependent hydrolase
VIDSARAGGSPQRAWQVVEVPRAAGGELLVANVHLPSNRQLGDEAAARKRIAELVEILDCGSRPEVMLGDLNEQPGGPLGAFLRESGYRDVAVLTASEGIGTTPKNRRGDQIWVAEPLSAAVAGYGAVAEEEMRTEIPGKEHLSDHFPLWIDLAV